MKHIFRVAGLIVGIVLSSGCSKGTVTDFYENVRGYGWLADDYYAAVAEDKQLPLGILNDVFLSFDGGADGPGLTYICNFHEGYTLKVAGFEKRGEETEVKFDPETEKTYGRREFFRVLERDASGPLVLARRLRTKTGDYTRLYRRVGVRNSGESRTKDIDAEIGCLLLCGKYSGPGGVDVVFLPGGNGSYAGKSFEYKIWVDYVLGPRFNVLALKDFLGADGEVGLDISRNGTLSFRRIKKWEEHESSWRLEDKPILQLKKNINERRDAGVRLEESAGRAGEKNADGVAGCRHFTESFLSWYVPLALSDGREPASMIALRHKPEVFSEEIRKSLEEDRKAQEQSTDIVGIDYDPFLSAQDPAEKYEVGKVTVEDGKCLADIKATGDAKRDWDVRAEAKQTGGVWRFTNYHYNTDVMPKDLLSILRDHRSARLAAPAGH